MRFPFETTEEMMRIFRGAYVSVTPLILRTLCKDPRAQEFIKKPTFETDELDREAGKIGEEAPIHRAAADGHWTLVEEYLNKGADPNGICKSKNNACPLLVCSFTYFSWKREQECFKILEMLLSNGADPNCLYESQNGDRLPALFFAVFELDADRHLENVLTLLLEKGADPNCRIVLGMSLSE